MSKFELFILPDQSRKYFNHIVKSYLGTYEVTNPELIGLFFRDARNTWITRQFDFAERFAWCAGFVYSMLKKSGKDLKYFPPAECVRAKSYIPESEGGLLKAKNVRLDTAKEGDIIVLKRGKNKYHVGTFVDYDNEFIFVRGGNQNNRVKVSKYPLERLVSIADYDTI